jgi:hypothetical protein
MVSLELCRSNRPIRSNDFRGCRLQHTGGNEFRIQCVYVAEQPPPLLNEL